MQFKRMRFVFSAGDTEQTVTVTGLDRIAVFDGLRAIEKSLADLSQPEWEMRHAYAAAKRLGIVAESVTFPEWAATVEAFEDVKDQGEPVAAPV